MPASHRKLHLCTLAALLSLPIAGAVHAGGDHCREEAKNRRAETADVYTVEGDVQKPLRTGGPVPAYPDFGKADRIQGRVVARVLVEKDGTVSEVEIVEPLRDDFDALTLDALRQWTFEPATLRGEPVRVYYQLTVNYLLDGGEDDSGGSPDDDAR